jgi:hypothetical protein
MMSMRAFVMKSLPMDFLRPVAAVVLTCLGFGLPVAQAQSITDLPPDMVTPPRLSVVEGSVQFARADADWARAELNTPLAVGDAVQTGSDGTVELQIGPRDFARVTADTTLSLSEHDAGMMRLTIDNGLGSFDLRGQRTGQVLAIDTANAAITIGGTGYYRVYARDDETRLTVRQGGRATVNFADGHSQNVVAGEEIIVQGDGSSVYSYPAPATDSWDRWNDARSDYYAAANSNRYVPTDVYGAADLDQYGNWRQDGAYGWIWMPAVASGWAPYSAGDWQWDPIYGWTWIDVAPWGWTTSHYGRWVFVGGHWAWAPGPRATRAVYAPALVEFYNVGGGGVGWVALSWGEPLIPWWGRPGFRGSAWWGGWGGPRAEWRDNHEHHHRNRDVPNALIGMHDSDFGHHNVRGSSFTIKPNIDVRPVRGDHPITFAPPRAISRPAGRDVGRPGGRDFGRPDGRDVGRPGGRDFGRDQRREPPPAVQQQRAPEVQTPIRRGMPVQPAPQEQPRFRREATPQAPPAQPTPELRYNRELQVQPAPQSQPQFRREPLPQVAPRPVQQPVPQVAPIQQPRPEIRPEPRERREPERPRFEPRPTPAVQAPAPVQMPMAQPRMGAPAAVQQAPEPRGGRDRDAGQQRGRGDDTRGRHDPRSRD